MEGSETIHHNQGHLPWAIMGDFNTVRFLDEKRGGKRLTVDKLGSFNQFIDDCKLPDIKSKGNYWSWPNRSLDCRKIMMRLDRILCNEHWINKLPESCYEYHSQSTSDHASLLLQIIPAIK